MYKQWNFRLITTSKWVISSKGQVGKRNFWPKETKPSHFCWGWRPRAEMKDGLVSEVRNFFSRLVTSWKSRSQIIICHLKPPTPMIYCRKMAYQFQVWSLWQWLEKLLFRMLPPKIFEKNKVCCSTKSANSLFVMLHRTSYLAEVYLINNFFVHGNLFFKESGISDFVSLKTIHTLIWLLLISLWLL